MTHTLRGVAIVLVLGAGLASAQEAKYTIKTARTDPPKALSDPIRKLLDSRSVQFTDAKGALVAEIWLRKQLPVDATPEQLKNGLGYRDLKETTVLGAIRFDQTWSDYRKQTIKPGTYTLRLAFQPMDGDHMGTAPHPEFLLVVDAKEDKNADAMEPKMLQEASAKTMGTSHPGVLLLFPNEKPGAAPQLISKDNNHLVLGTKVEMRVGATKTTAPLGIGLTLVGHTE